jgi:hypothetical protein
MLKATGHLVLSHDVYTLLGLLLLAALWWLLVFLYRLGGRGLRALRMKSTPRSAEDSLKELKRLHDAGLITDEVYAERQRAVLGAS